MINAFILFHEVPTGQKTHQGTYQAQILPNGDLTQIHEAQTHNKVEYEDAHVKIGYVLYEYLIS